MLSHGHRIPPSPLGALKAAAAKAAGLPEPLAVDWASCMEFVRKGGARSARMLDAWDRRRRRTTQNWEELRREFESFSHRVLFRLRPVDFFRAVAATDHALGELRPEDERFGGMDNWSPPVPFMYVFHVLLERLGRVPLWQDAVSFIWGDGRDLLWTPFLRDHNLSPDSQEAQPGSAYVNAFVFRVGKNYYSWFRETHLLTELRRTHGTDARYHFLVDAEWKADIFAGDVLVELYVKNPKYKDDDGKGRKALCKKVNPWTEPLTVAITRRKARGKPWLVDEAEIAELAASMRDKGAPLIAAGSA